MDKRGSESQMRRIPFMVTVFTLFLAAAIVGFSSDPLKEGQNFSSFKHKLDEVLHSSLEVVRGGSVVLLVKFLNFCIAKFVQIRLLSLTQMASYSVGSILFWAVLTQSVFDLYN